MDKIIYSVLVVAVVVGGVYVAYTSYMSQVQSEALQLLYASIETITLYEQDVETELMISDRKVHVEGTYQNDRGSSTFASFATTTLSVPGEVPYSFSLSNIVVGDDIRFKLERVSGDLTSAAPMGPEWHTFTKTSIPQPFVGIAVPGPILDNLALFRSNAKALTLLKSIKNDSSFGEPLTRLEYSIAPSDGSEEPPVTAVRERLTGVGTVSMWADPGLTSIRYIVLRSTDYVSTTTIKSVNIPFSTLTPAE